MKWKSVRCGLSKLNVVVFPESCVPIIAIFIVDPPSYIHLRIAGNHTICHLLNQDVYRLMDSLYMKFLHSPSGSFLLCMLLNFRYS